MNPNLDKMKLLYYGILLGLFWVCVYTQDPPACSSHSYYENASGYCMFLKSPIEYADNRSHADQLCRNVTPSARLATGETPAKWQGLKNLTEHTPTFSWVHVNMRQYPPPPPPPASPTHYQDWKWLVDNEMTVVPIDESFSSDVIPLTMSADENFGYFQWDSAGGPMSFDDNYDGGYSGVPLCQYELPGVETHGLHEDGFVEAMARELTYECETQLQGTPMGSSCYYTWPPGAGTANNTQCVNEAYKHPDVRQAHLYTSEMLSDADDNLLATAPQPHFIGLKNKLNDMTGSYWIDEHTGNEEHGYKQTDRPDVEGMAVIPSSECTMVPIPNNLPEVYRPPDPTACSQQQKCLMERKIPGERYHLEHNTHYQPNAPILNTIEGENNDPRQCAFRCLMQRGCLSFNLRADNNTCQLLPVKLTTADDGGVITTMVDGWDYYERIDHNVFG